MPTRPSLAALALLACLQAACGQGDAPVADPGGMGAGQPDTDAVETGVPGGTDSALEVLEGTGVGPMGQPDSAAADTAR